MANKKATPKHKRAPISNKMRFDVFKRDNFICKYCGKGTKDGIVLNVDHIIPVSKGGKNESENLITSCFECNSGKKATLLESKTINDTKEVIIGLKEKLNKQKEIEKQLKEYYKLSNKLKFNNPTAAFIRQTLRNELNIEFSNRIMADFLKLYAKVTLDEFLDAISIVKSKTNLFGPDVVYKYLCGVLHNKYKERTDPFYREQLEIKRYFLYHPNKRGSDYYVEWQMRKYIENLTIDAIKECIDKVYSMPRKAYFKTLLSFCNDTFYGIEQ